jgi:hypothetical protein
VNPVDRTPPTKVLELRLERVLGRRVLTANNRSLGRIEEFRTEQHGGSLVISEYVLGEAGLLERLGVAVRLLFQHRIASYVARWDQLDLSDQGHCRLRCPVEELRREP